MTGKDEIFQMYTGTWTVQQAVDWWRCWARLLWWRPTMTRRSTSRRGSWWTIPVAHWGETLLGGTRQQTRVKPAEQDVRTANINVMRAYLGELELVMHQAEEGPRAGNPDRDAAHTWWGWDTWQRSTTCTPWTSLPGWWRPWWWWPTSTWWGLRLGPGPSLYTLKCEDRENWDRGSLWASRWKVRPTTDQQIRAGPVKCAETHSCADISWRQPGYTPGWGRDNTLSSCQPTQSYPSDNTDMQQS